MFGHLMAIDGQNKREHNALNAIEPSTYGMMLTLQASRMPSRLSVEDDL